MKTLLKLAVLCVCAGIMTACASQKEKQEKYHRKIYLTEEDYLSDLSPKVQQERREVKAGVESEYIFNLRPETEKNVYFFDERNVPQVPGEPSDAAHRKEKRLWKKPRRYAPEEYYGAQSSEESESSSFNSDDNYDY